MTGPLNDTRIVELIHNDHIAQAVYSRWDRQDTEELLIQLCVVLSESRRRLISDVIRDRQVSVGNAPPSP